MSGTAHVPTGVVCDDRPAVRRRVSALLVRYGILVVGEADGFVALLKLVLGSHPTLAVVTLPLSGTSGLTAVSALRAAAPSCDVVLLSALGNLELAAREAGAYAVLPEDDPQALAAVLRELVHERQEHSETSTSGVPVLLSQTSYEEAVPDRDPPSRAGTAGSSTTKPDS